MKNNTVEPGNRKLFFNPDLQIIFGITLIAVLGVANLTPAFPKMQKALNISTEQVGLLITIFTLPGVFLTPMLGVLADRWGRKRVIIPSLFVFGIMGTLCAFTTDFNMLLMLRFIQGIGAAALGSMNVTLIGDIFTGNERTSAMGYNASVLSIGTASYPAIGGAVAVFGWNYPFVMSIAAIPVGLFVIFKLNNPETKNNQRIKDYLSSAFQSINNRKVIGLYIGSIATFIILYGAFLSYFPFLIASKFHSSTVVIGVLMSAMSVSTALISSQLGKLVNKIPETKLLRYSYLVYGTALILIPFMPDLLTLIFPVILFGIGHGVNFPSIQTLLAGLAPGKYRAAFMSLNGTVLRLGQTLGPVLMALVLSVSELNYVFFSAALLAFLMSLLAYILVK